MWAAAVALILVGLSGITQATLAWTGRYRNWQRMSVIFGRSISYFFPLGVGILLVGVSGFLPSAGAGLLAARVLFALGGAFAFIAVVFFFWQPRWVIPPWAREDTSSQRPLDG